MPFVTEEIYQNLPIKNKKMLIIKRWKNYDTTKKELQKTNLMFNLF